MHGCVMLNRKSVPIIFNPRLTGVFSITQLTGEALPSHCYFCSF